MISIKEKKEACRKALENQCVKYNLPFNKSDTNADLCKKINIYLNI